MARRKTQPIPHHSGSPTREPELYVLDRFSAKDIEVWQSRSADLDELLQRFYLDSEADRIRRHNELCDALLSKPAEPLELDGWVRMLTYRWSCEPLSAAGSLCDIGGRFNIGRDVDYSRAGPFPALYLGQDETTAASEYFQHPATPAPDGLSREELALVRPGSYSTVRVRGRIGKVFDARDAKALAPICAVLRKIKEPPLTSRLAKRLKMPPIKMVKNPQDLLRIFARNWREWPQVYGVPGTTQLFGELLRASGYEALLYQSTKNPAGTCLAVYPCNLTGDSYIELVDAAPDGTCSRLDRDNAETMAGWAVTGVRPGRR